MKNVNNTHPTSKTKANFAGQVTSHIIAHHECCVLQPAPGEWCWWQHVAPAPVLHNVARSSTLPPPRLGAAALGSPAPTVRQPAHVRSVRGAGPHLHLQLQPHRPPVPHKVPVSCPAQGCGARPRCSRSGGGESREESRLEAAAALSQSQLSLASSQ